MQLNLVGNIAYNPPGNPSLQAQLSLGAVATYTAQVQGTLDVATGVAGGTVLNVPFGSIATAKGFYLKANGVAAKVAVNGATGAPFSLGTGGVMVEVSPQAAPASTANSIQIITIANQAVDGAGVDFAVWGD